MKPLRYPYFWFAGGLVLVALLLFSTLTPSSPAPVLTFNDKAAHGISFFVLMVWFAGVYQARFAPLIAMALMLLGITIELLQSQLAYRSAELLDGLADFVGIMLGWLLATAGLGRWTAVVESLLLRKSG